MAMFCTTLRKRTDLTGVITRLTSTKDFHLQETNLTTHDLEFLLPTLSPNSASNSTLRILILSPASLGETSIPLITDRIERFSSLTGGDCIAIAFLLHASSFDQNQQPQPVLDAMHAFTTLQVLIHTHPSLSPTGTSISIPILPIPTLSHLMPLLKVHITLLSSPPPSSSSSLFKLSSLRLLPHLTANAPTKPLSEHATYVLSDICHSIKDVAVLAGEGEGAGVLENYLGREEGRGIVEFWGEEWVSE